MTGKLDLSPRQDTKNVSQTNQSEKDCRDTKSCGLRFHTHSIPLTTADCIKKAVGRLCQTPAEMAFHRHICLAPRALVHASLGQRPREKLPNPQRALKARIKEASASVPHIALVKFDAVFVQKLAILFLKTMGAMVLFLT
ncbi:MAG: hypothetical protein QOG67_2041, partial [Verrucomicrobiota bacterium]